MREIKDPEWLKAKIKAAKILIRIWSVVGGIVVGFMALLTLPPSPQNYSLYFERESVSPCGSHIARWYLRLGGGAAGFSSHDGHIIDVATGQSRHVVSSARRGFMTIEWIDDTNVMFNDRRINVANRGLRANDYRNLAIAGGVYILMILFVCIHIERLQTAKKHLTG